MEDAIFTALSDGAWIVDPRGRIIDANPALLGMLGIEDRSAVINKNPGDFASVHCRQELLGLFETAAAGGTAEAESVLVTKAGNELSVSVILTPLKGPGGELRGCLAVVKDNTRRRKADDAVQTELDELARSNQQLKNVISQIKTLHGLVKICAQCKRICTDSGEWQKLEEYITAHTDAEFSHGLCSHCSSEAIKNINLQHAADKPSENTWES